MWHIDKLVTVTSSELLNIVQSELLDCANV